MRSLLWSLPLLVACASDAMPDEGESGPDGKGDAATVERLLDQLINDGELSAADIDKLFESAGETVNKAEMLVIRDAVEGTGYTIPADATARALERATTANLLAAEVRELSQRGGYGGNKVPAKVSELLSKARLNGAAAFDVRETDSQGEGVWNPYPTTTPPTENMTFQYTLITPEGLAADLANSAVEYNAIIGTEEVTQGGQTFEQVKYARHRGGTGRIAAQYDEAFHPDIFARGSVDQKWANNCAFLSDGTIHCLPAARRSEFQDLILTNPHLSRCSDVAGFEDDCHTLMYMGHIEASNGVITGIEVSGRLSKEIGKGRINGIDPIALFEAWGFQLRAGLTISFGNSSDGRPVRDLERGVITRP